MSAEIRPWRNRSSIHEGEDHLMKKLLCLLAATCCAASMAFAGPNAGGVLVVHDFGPLVSDTDWPPLPEPAPADCNGIDVTSPYGELGAPRIWKVYAAFPAGSSPRLQALAWGISFVPQGDGYLQVLAGLMPNSAVDLEQPQLGWPTHSGGWVGMSFPGSGTRTALMNEVYWFAGYAYGGPSGTDVQYFCTTAPSGTAAMFVDDAPTPNFDPIAGYGCLGFGGPGHVTCPVAPDPTGSCCHPDGSCSISTRAGCTGAWIEGGVCEPNTCGIPFPTEPTSWGQIKNTYR
jgi:hypothetical protein